MAELNRRYGDPDTIAQAYVNKALNWRQLKADDAASLDAFGIFLQECLFAIHEIDALRVLDFPDTIKRLVAKLPSCLGKKWLSVVYNLRESSATLHFRDLVGFVLKEAKKLNDPVYGQAPPQPSPPTSLRRKLFKPNPTHPVKKADRKMESTLLNIGRNETPRKKCPLCQDGGDHFIYKCTSFISKTVKERREVARSHQLCFNCLKHGHQVASCKSSIRCQEEGCGKAHHTLLHIPQKEPSTKKNNNLTSNTPSPRSYFQLIPAYACFNGRSVPTTVLLDSASEITIVRQSLAKKLGLRGKLTEITVNTMSGSTVRRSQTVALKLRSLDLAFPDPVHLHGAQVIDVPFFQCSSQELDPSWEHCAGLAIPPKIDPQDVDILIGVDHPELHIQYSVRLGDKDQPMAVQTSLGWSLMGVGTTAAVDVEDSHGTNLNLITHCSDGVAPNMEQFWSTESFGVAHDFPRPTSLEDRKAMKILEKTTSFVDGRYQVGMLWKDPDSTLPNNYPVALRRYNLLLKRFAKDPDFAELYQETLNGYVDKGYAQRLTPDEAASTPARTWYLPHHGVVNPHKPGRVRVVFDAAAAYHGTSLNQKLSPGPDLLASLFGILQRFRLYSVAVSADIEQMFMRVSVLPEDTDALRFVHKRDVRQPGPPDTYRMKSHIFGAACSPACAIYALHQTAHDHKGEFSEQAVESVQKDFYMDDLLKSVDGVTSAIPLVQEVTQLTAKGGFRLHKWLSNREEVLAAMEVSEVAGLVDFNEGNLPRTLGVRWDVRADEFSYTCTLKERKMTKRGVVSTMCSIFDPCGFISPFIARAKFLTQELWRSGLEWDESLPKSLQEEWLDWTEEMETIDAIRIPRHHRDFTSQTTCVELHVFSDASEKGFGAVAYLRYRNAEGETRCSFLASRCRVAPLKTLSIPRLELQGALLAARLRSTLQQELGIDLVRKINWTDSEVVLKYVQNGTKRFTPFVANRVAEIQDLTEVDDWRHVPTRLNPADICSRGASIASLTPQSLWFAGPPYLTQDEKFWPSTEISPRLDVDDPELRKSETGGVVVHHLGVGEVGDVNQQKAVQLDVTRIVETADFSSWPKLVRRVAWVRRAVQNFASCLPRLGLKQCREPYLTPSEYNGAILHLVQRAQRDGFADELSALEAGDPISVKSSLIQLTPFWDEATGCLRVGGRLRRAPIPFDVKYQLLLPPDHAVTRLQASHLHAGLAHGGQEHLIAELRRKYWPVQVRRLAKHTVNKCVRCRQLRAKPIIPRMADLPPCRLSTSSGAFAATGVDYFGPMFVKVRRSTEKRWGCLFVCMSTRAVHLELAGSLSTDDFILCLRNFIGRRGHPHDLYSDNGTNFRGAEAELSHCLRNLDQGRINGHLTPLGTSWHFNPPAAPHFGGAWERLVSSTKAALKAALKNVLVCEPVLHTSLIEVEATLNSRPLTHNSPDQEDLAALTPNHFLLGRSDNTSPADKCADKEIDSRRRWRQCQVIADRVNRRWLREYLPKLTVRPRWWSDGRAVQKGDLVMLVDYDLPRGKWELGRILDTHPGDDGRVRSVDVKTTRSVLSRPVAKICVLEENYDLLCCNSDDGVDEE